MTISSKDVLINEKIREKQVRVIGDDGEQLGIMSSQEALEIAYNKNLDLVLIAPNGQPPVCRVMDFGRYQFEQQKREKEARKNQKVIDVKEIQMTLNIDTHDFNTKVNHAVKFLQGGDKVKIRVKFRGREMAHTERGNELVDRIMDVCGEYGTAEKEAKMEGRNMFLIIAPRKDSKDKKTTEKSTDKE